jgi:tRNA threonylcarbamoyladenosine biosynthesis protein TsaB
MAKILAIESTGKFCSVALRGNGEQHFLKDKNEFNHSAILHLLIDELFSKVDITPKELDAVAISGGPGSYTGLRIGSSTAKGVCEALSIPLISVPSHDSMLHNEKLKCLEKENTEILCLTDARRRDVFYSLYSNGKKKEGVSVISIDDYAWQEKIRDKNLFVIGSGAEKFKEVSGKSHVILIGESLSANQVLQAANSVYVNGDFEDIANYEPSYEKAFYSTMKTLK